MGRPGPGGRGCSGTATTGTSEAVLRCCPQGPLWVCSSLEARFPDPPGNGPSWAGLHRWPGHEMLAHTHVQGAQRRQSGGAWARVVCLSVASWLTVWTRGSEHALRGRPGSRGRGLKDLLPRVRLPPNWSPCWPRPWKRLLAFGSVCPRGDMGAGSRLPGSCPPPPPAWEVGAHPGSLVVEGNLSL